MASSGEESSPLTIDPTAKSFDPHPSCSLCDEFVKDRWLRRDEGSDAKWSTSQLFHDSCDSCTKKELAYTPLCQFCRHLRLRHLSLCVPSHQLPPKIPIRKPDPDSTCPLCQFILRVSRREYLPRKRKRVLEFPLYLSTTQWHAQQVQWRVTGPDFWSTPAEFLVVQDDDIPIPVLGDLFLPATDNVHSAISQCLEHHESCNGPTDTLLPPNFRLVDIQRRCILVPADTTDKPYVALSYVWGESTNADWLTKMNINERLETLDIEELPATIRDAIVTCEKLGERYLWIDRLCILQDDERDKASQVHSMSSIYTGAKFVIIEASSNGINDGMAGVSRARKAQISEKLAGLNINVQLPPLWDVVGPTSWNSRGWTYQEAILPLRKVYFTQSQVFYECSLRIDHEETLVYSSFDHSMHNKANYPTTTTSLCYNAEQDCSSELAKTKLSKRAETPWQAYARHLSRYRQRMLRQSSDLLSAFSGIVGALYPGDKSYYGLPTADFDLALLWGKWKDPYIRKIPLSGTPEIRNDDLDLFPSWSWASATDLIVGYDNPHDFCGSLCLWFQPDTIKGQLRPVLASSQAASRWIKATGNQSIGHLEKLRRADLDALYKLWVKLLAENIIQSPVCVNAVAWNLKSSSDVADELAERWPSYAAFWQDVHGQEKAMRDTQIRLAEEVHDRVRDGVIVTRAQIGSVEIRMSSASFPTFRGSGKREKFNLHNHHGRIIGYVRDGYSQRIKDFLHEDSGNFEHIALSVSAHQVQIEQRSNVKKSSRKNEDEHTSGPESSVSEENGNRGKPKVQVTSTENRWELEHRVNILIMCRKNGYCYRIGLGEIKLDDWLELSRRLETIVLC
ncbi:heterokaryon incompatibility protein-domain-containing protein [Xylaria cubensis]|nr:heterokaryon incompatibility protein-domain-containing protein [Xylaria cubensis]